MSKEKLTQKWTVASFFGAIPVGFEFPREETPLHATLAGVFAINQTGDDIAAILNEGLDEERAFDIEGEVIESWGEGLNVTTIKRSDEFDELYRKVQEILLNNSAVFNEPEYLGDGFRPHVTVQKSGRLGIGSTAVIRNVSLVDMFPNSDGNQRRIHATIKLREND